MDLSHSGHSFEVIEPNNRITFTSSSDDPGDISRDHELDYSRDQPSLSFQIEPHDSDEKKPRPSQDAPLHLTNEPPKRKRRQIFDKYRKPGNDDVSNHDSLSLTQGEDIMRTFDEIFHINTPKALDSPGKRPDSNQFFKKKSLEGPAISFQSVSSKKSMSWNDSRDRSQDKFTEQDVEIQKLKEPDLANSDFFKPPQQSPPPVSQLGIGKNDILNLEDLEYRYSFIEGKQNSHDFSRDSVDLADILDSEIFKEESQKSEQTRLPVPIVNDKSTVPIPLNKPSQIVSPFAKTLPANIQVHPASTKISPPAHHTSSPDKQAYLSALNKEKALMSYSSLNDLSKFPDPYQQIDMSASVTSSVMFKDTRYFPQNTNFLGNTLENLSAKGAKSAGDLFGGEETMSKKLSITEEHLDERLPIFIRRIRFLNSIYPNLNHPSVGRNHDVENENLQKIVSQFYLALKFLDKTLQNIKFRDAKRKEIIEDFAAGITLAKFQDSRWEEFELVEDTHKLEPKISFQRREWNQRKVEKALGNYKKITDYYRGAVINLADERGITKYLDVRRKFWDVEKNIIMIAEDMYLHILEKKFPPHYHEVSQVLALNKSFYKENEVRQMKALMQKLQVLHSRGDPLCVSEVGELAMEKLGQLIRISTPL